MSEKKHYVIGTTTPEAWERVHAILTQDGTLEDNIPSRSVECTDLKEHSPTRAVYLLDDSEAEQLTACPDVKFIHLEKSLYPDLFPKPPADEFRASDRYTTPTKNYREVTTYPNPTTTADLNRAGYQILRGTSYANPWASSATTVISSTVPNVSGTGKDVDVIVGDEGCWFGHVEFANNTGTGPADYIGGNVLPGNGTCDLLDLVLDGPYYIDPAWFNASPSTRLTTRWDGTTVPVEGVARDWWASGSNRSSQFASAGTVSIPSFYTRANCNGSDTAKPDDGYHGTPCSAQTYGRTHGWAYNANKWIVNAYGNNGLWPVDNYFDVVKIFHQNKPVNPTYGTKDPTITSNSWGFRTTQGTSGYYYFRQGTSGSGGVAYASKPAFMQYLGSTGDAGRFKGEMLDNSVTAAGDEAVAAGVIFVVAAGNSNQQQVTSSHPNYNNYWSSSASTPLASATHSEFGELCYNTTSRRGFPQQIGKYYNGTATVYPAINIGALDNSYTVDGLERKVNYSDMGNDIDVYTPGDDTLTATWGSGLLIPRHDQRGGSALTSHDGLFNGTSSACPTAAGMIATVLEINRTWTWQDIRTWLQSLTLQSTSTFYVGTDPTSATDPAWGDLNSLMGGVPRILYNNISLGEPLTATTAVSQVSLNAYDPVTPVTPVVAAGGTGDYTYQISPALPNGLAFSNAGSISGTPVALSSTATYTVTIDDTADTTSSNFALNVYATPLTATVATSIIRIKPFVTTTAFTPVTASGGNGTKSYSIAPSLPGTLTYNTSSGQVSAGTVNSVFTTTYTVTASDQVGQTSSTQFVLTSEVTPLVATVQVSSTSSFALEAVTPFTPVTSTGGDGVVTYSISPALPAGLTFNTTTGQITGTPTALSNQTTYTVTATDQLSQNRTGTFSLSVIARPIVITPVTQKVVYLANQNITPFNPLTATGGSGSVTYSISPALPEDLSLNSSTGVISGNTGQYMKSTLFTIAVTDQVGQTKTYRFSFKVASPLNLIEAEDENLIYDSLFSVMGTTATGYGAVLLGDPVQPGQLIDTIEWNELKVDIERCLIHQNGTSTNNIIPATTGTLVDFTTPARMYTAIQFLQKNIDQVHPSQIDSFTYNTNRVSPVYWTSTNYSSTTTMIAGNGYMSTINWTWFYDNQVRYFFNLGGKLQPQISIVQAGIKEKAGWQGLVNAANQVVFGRAEFLQALSNPNQTYTYVLTSSGAEGDELGEVRISQRTKIIDEAYGKRIIFRNKDANKYAANALTITFRIMGSTIVGSMNFVAGIALKKKGPKKKTGKEFYKRYNKKNVVIGTKVIDIFTKQIIGKYIGVRVKLETDFKTTYSTGANGGIAAQIPQTQIIANSVSAAPSPIPEFVLGIGETESQTIILRNNSTLTCNVSDIVLSGYTTGTVSTSSFSIPAYSSSSFVLSYTGSHPGHHKGLVDVLCNVNRLTLFTEVNVGSTNPQNLILTTSTYDVISQDFAVDHAGGYFKSFSAEFTPGTGYTFTPLVAGTNDTFNVTFNPNNLMNGVYTAGVDVTVTPLDSSQEPSVWNVPISITLAVQNRHIADWISCKLGTNTFLGLSYDIIGGRTYLTAGLGQGSPAISQLRDPDLVDISDWDEVYRIPLESAARRIYSKDYRVKVAEGFAYGDYFGVGNARGSVLTCNYDGKGNLEVLLNTVYTVPGTNTTEVLDLSTAFRYYDSRRANQLQTLSSLTQGGQTFVFNGFDRSGDVLVSLVSPN